MPNHRARFATIAAVVALTGCGADGAAPSDPTASEASTSVPIDPSSSTTEVSPPPSTAPDSTPETTATIATSTVPPTTADDRSDLDPLVVAAIDDLASTRERAPDEIDLVLFERVTWRSGALGCPQPGYSYTQALVDGYRIVLSLDGSRFVFHGAAGSPPFLCDDPQDPAPGDAGGGGDT